MKGKLSVLAVVLVSAALLSGCAMAVAPVSGGLYTDVKGGWAATSNDGSSKVGKATCTSILGWVALGDCSIEAASNKAGIKKIHHVDYHTRSFLGIYAEHTAVVYGE
jgi:hypothetical protein